MKTRFIRILACVLLVSVALFTFASCAEGTDTTTSAAQSEASNPFGDSFSPTNPGDTSLGNAASGLQEPPSYPPGYEC